MTENQLAALAVGLLATGCACGAELAIAERGKPADYSIAVPSDAGASVRYAAEELQSYVRQMTDCELPIVTPGEKNSAASGRAVCLRCTGDGDSFRIKAEGGDISVTGGTRGVLYGVYDLLETFGGVGWYASWRTVVPKRDRFAVPDTLDVAQSPAFAMRQTSWYDTRNLTDANVAFAARLRLNSDRNIYTDERGGKYGGVPYRFGGGLGACHTFNVLLPPEKHFDEHPEWYSEVKGVRQKAHAQLCLTNPDVLRMVTSNVLERIRRDPGATFYGVSQNDCFGYCECANCAAVDAEEESHAGTNVRFVNAVAEAVEREFPGKFIETLAYQYTRKPPKKTKLRRNVIACLCSIECSFNRPFGASREKANVSFENDMKAWSAQTDNLFCWDYSTDFSDYLHVFPNVYTLASNLRFFRDNGVKFMYEQGDSRGLHADFAELKAWLIAKMMWNPDQPVEPLLDRFFKGYYGAAAPYVRQYFEEAQALGRREGVRFWGIYTRAEDSGSKVPDEFLVRATNLWEKAKAAVNGDPVLSYNVRMGAASPLLTLSFRGPTDIRAWVSRSPERYDVAGARRMVAELLECQKLTGGRICWTEDRRNGLREKRWRAFMESDLPPAPQDVAVVPAEDLLPGGIGSRRGIIVDDADSAFGRVLKLPPSHCRRDLVRIGSRSIAYDEGATYRLRVRVKVDRKPGGRGEAFWAGVNDDARRRECGMIAPKVEDIADGWQWYDVAAWKPERDQHFWFGPGRFDTKNLRESPAHNGVYIDALEISRVDAEPSSSALLRKSCADPWLFRHGGRFYLTQTGGTKVMVEEAETLPGLSSPDCGKHIAYDATRDPMLATLGYKGVSGVWSPEIHCFSESDFPGASGWYLFVALRDAAPGDSSRVKSVVLKSLSGRPEGPYGNPGTGEKFSSGLVLDREGKPYGGWLVGQSVLRIGSGRWKGVYSLFVTEVGRGTADFHQEIRIARLAAPWRMATETGVVTVPTQPWESIGSGLSVEGDGGRPSRYLPRVVEGATAVYGERDDVYLIYSGSGYWTNYGLGQLTWTGGDPLKTSSWIKWKGNPVFSVADASGRHYPGVDRQGAGHASFFTGDDGRRMMVYHAYPYNSSDVEKEVDGTVLAPRRKAKRRNAYVAPYSIDYSESNGVGMGVFHAPPVSGVESGAADVSNRSL